ncbi:MAG: tetratricopeptide repeat protein [Acidobacteria bacterium]|nr:tetratricopeptide repeat protein [Acidobacteriota bacterium]
MKLELGDRDGAGFSHHNIGEVLADQGKHEEALESFIRAEAAWRAVDNRRALAAALKSQGQALASLGRPDQSIRKLNASLTLRDDPPNPHGKAETLLILCRVQLLLGRSGEAVENCSSALSIAESLDQTTIIGDALAGLAAAEAASGNVPAAGSLLEKQLALQRRMREQERARLRSEMRATLEAHEAERHAERLEHEAALREEALGRRAAERNMALIAAVLLLVIAGIAINRFRLKRESEQRFRRQAEELSLALGQVKTLRGLLPLCAWCHRKVRDDEGNWTRLETFVQRHTDAEVTHSICPECKETTFPKKTGGKDGDQ